MCNEIVAEGSGQRRTLTAKNKIGTTHPEINFPEKEEVSSCDHTEKMIY